MKQVKLGLLTLGLGVLGALTMRADAVTDISSGGITRSYIYNNWFQGPAEFDSLTLSGSSGGVDFSIHLFGGTNLTESYVSFGPTFTDQITASFAELCMPSCGIPGPSPIYGTLTLDVQATLNGFSHPYGCDPLLSSPLSSASADRLHG